MCYIFEKQALRGYQIWYWQGVLRQSRKVGKSERQKVRKSAVLPTSLMSFLVSEPIFNSKVQIKCRPLWQSDLWKFKPNKLRWSFHNSCHSSALFSQFSFHIPPRHQINFADNFPIYFSLCLKFALLPYQKKLIKLRRQKNQTPHYPFQAPRLFLLGTAIHSQVPQPTSKH